MVPSFPRPRHNSPTRSNSRQMTSPLFSLDRLALAATWTWTVLQTHLPNTVQTQCWQTTKHNIYDTSSQSVVSRALQDEESNLRTSQKEWQSTLTTGSPAAAEKVDSCEQK